MNNDFQEILLQLVELNRHYESLSGSYKNLSEQMEEIRHDLYGNGNVGMKIKLDRLEQTDERRTWFSRMALGSSFAALLAVAGIIIKFLLH